MNTFINSHDYFVVAYEAGAEHPELPTWASKKENIANLTEAVNEQESVLPISKSITENFIQNISKRISKQRVNEVPGAFQLLNVLTKDECERLIAVSESMGYLADAAVSLPREVRHNDSLTWVVDQQTDGIIWDRIKHLMVDDQGIFEGKQALGLNARFRFYRYREGDYFKPHSDGSWPGSRVINDQLVADAYGDRYSQLTFLIFLTDDFEGGATRFFVNADDTSQPARRDDKVKEVDVRTPAGSVLCFPHGMHPLHCIHSSGPIYKGVKYIIRTDVLFEL